MLQIVAGESVEARQASGGWIDVVAPSPQEIDALTAERGIPEELVAHCLDPDEVPRIVVDERVTLVVLQVPFTQHDRTAPLPYETVPLGIILSGDWVVTVCPRENQVLAALRRFAASEWPLRKQHRLLLHALEITAETYLAHLRAIAREVDAIEARLSTSLANREVLELLRYQKSLIYYGTALRASERLLERLQRSPVFHIPEEDEDRLADLLVEIRQAIDVATVSGNILGEMMDAFASIISNNLNVVMKFLAAVTVVLTLPVAIASFYGMNVELPFQRSAHAFLGTLVVSVVVAAAVAVFFRRRGWL